MRGKSRGERERPLFPGWSWAAVALAFPVAGLIGWTIGGPVDAPGAALVGGLLTGGGLGGAQWLAAKGLFGTAWIWVATSAGAYGVGLMLGAVVVGYGTDLGSLILMGVISGLVLGAAQGAALYAQGRPRLALAWAAAMPVLFALGWTASTAIGVDVDEQFTVFGAVGAIVFTLLSGLVVQRFRPVPPTLA